MLQPKFKKNTPDPKKSSLGDAERKLDELLVEERCYQSSDLDLRELSRMLGLSKRKTSLIIQKQYGKSFSECINDFRLEEVLHRFEHQKHKNLTIIALALEVGFPSKSTFYRYFKRKIGKSPSEFLEQMDIQES